MFLGLPIGLYVIAFAVAGLIVLAIRYTSKTGAIEDSPIAEITLDAINAYDGSALDEYIGSMFKTLSPEFREVVKDIVEVASPITDRTKNDLDNKTLAKLREYLASDNQTDTQEMPPVTG